MSECDLIEFILVGGIPTALKSMSSSIGMIVPNLWENEKKCSKPPSSSLVSVKHPEKELHMEREQLTHKERFQPPKRSANFTITDPRRDLICTPRLLA